MSKGKKHITPIFGILFWDIVIWSIGVWQGWWKAGVKSITIASVIFLFFVFSILSQSSNSKNIIDDLEQFQLRRLRNLDYQVSPQWNSERTDDVMWVSIRFFLENPHLIIHIGVRWIGDNEDTTPEGLQAYAKKHYESQLGFKLERNEIINFLERPCVISESSYKNPDNSMGKVHRYSFVILGSEYFIQFTSSDEKFFASAETFINNFLDQCHFAFPNLQEKTIFGGKIKIGIPENNQQIQNDDSMSFWKILPGPLNIKIYFIGKHFKDRLETNIFHKIPDFKENENCISTRYRIEEYGLTVLNYKEPKKFSWSMDAVKLPSGNIVIIEFENQGDEDIPIQGFLMGPLERSIIASISDESVPYL